MGGARQGLGRFGCEVVIGPNANKPLLLERPLFVSDMSFGALSEEAKVSLAMGADLGNTR
jgi:glutamate synthase domain-containing protein 2